jgi:hypothetical protein
MKTTFKLYKKIHTTDTSTTNSSNIKWQTLHPLCAERCYYVIILHSNRFDEGNVSGRLGLFL